MGIPIIGDIIDSVIGKAGSIASELIVDKDKQTELRAQLERLRIDESVKAADREHNLRLAQIEVNKVEASSSNVFIAGWRPAAGWVSVAGLTYAVILEPMGSWTARVLFKYVGPFPEIDPTLLLFTLGGMLGIGTLRTIEKVKGVVTEEPSPIPKKQGIPIEQLNMGPDGRVYGEVVPLPENAPWAK